MRFRLLGLGAALSNVAGSTAQSVKTVRIPTGTCVPSETPGVYGGGGSEGSGSSGNGGPGGYVNLCVGQVID